MLPPVIQRMTDEYQMLSSARGAGLDIKEVLFDMDKEPVLYQARSGVIGTVPFFKFYKAPVLVESKDITLACSRGTFAAINAMRYAQHEKERVFLAAASQLRAQKDCNGIEHFIYQPEYEVILTLDQDKMEYRKMSIGKELYTFEFNGNGSGIERSDLGEKACNTVPFATMREVNQFFDEMHAWVRKFIR